MKIRTTIRKGDAVAVAPEGQIGQVHSVWSDRGKRFASVRMKLSDAVHKVPVQSCKRIHLPPDEKPQEPTREYGYRVVNRESGLIVDESDWFPTKVEVERLVKRVLHLYTTEVEVQLIERTERVCRLGTGTYNPQYFNRY